jgi:hypothetical protein
MSAVLPSSARTGKASSPMRLQTPPVPPAGAAAASDDDPHDTLLGAVERLAVSRERLRAAMLPAPRASGGGSFLADGIGAYASGLLDRLRANPGLAVLLDAVQEWWAKHPLHTAGVMAAEASRRLAAPIAERRPLTLVFGAVLVGALLALLRPWRWLLRPAVFAGLLPAILLRVARELPVETWVKAATGFGAAPRPPAEARTPAGAGTPFAATASVAAAATVTDPAARVEAVAPQPSNVYP